MARMAGKATKLSEIELKVYVGKERMRYLKLLYFARRKELGIGDGFYSMSRFLRDIIALYIKDRWGIIESYEKTLKEAMKGKEEESKQDKGLERE